MQIFYTTKLNSMALVRERTIPTERPLPVSEVSANFILHNTISIVYFYNKLNFIKLSNRINLLKFLE
jgi:hypothetical protein